MKRIFSTILTILMVLSVSVWAQQPTDRHTINNIAVLGGVSAGSSLGYHPGGRIGVDVDYTPKEKWEIVERLFYDFAGKIGSDHSHSVDERILVRYGDTWFVGAGGLVCGVTGAFGSRVSFSPLINAGIRIGEDYWLIVPSVTVRPIEWGNNFTREHDTRGADIGIEAYQAWGKKWGTKERVNLTVLRFNNIFDPKRHTGTGGDAEFGFFFLF